MPERTQDGSLEGGGLGVSFDPLPQGQVLLGADLGVIPHSGDYLALVTGWTDPGLPVYRGAWTILECPDAVNGEPLLLSAWLRDYYHDPGSSQFTVEAEHDPGDGIWQPVGTDPMPLAGDWEQAICGLATAGAGPNRVRFRVTWALGNRYDAWGLWDDFSAWAPEDIIMQSRWLAHQALIARLKLLNGTNYRLNVSSRVFPRLFVPMGEAVSLLPYICVPLYGDAPTFEHHATHLMMRWRVNIHGFVHEENVAYNASTAVRDCYYGVEDVLKVLMQDTTLTGTVRDVKALEGGGSVAAADDLGYGEFHVPVELMLALGPDVLGP